MDAILEVEKSPTITKRRIPRRICNRQPLPTHNPIATVQNIAINADWTVECYADLAHGISAWRELPTTDNLFLSDTYLNLLQQIDLPGITTGMAIFRPQNGEQPFGIILQAFSFSAREQLGNLDQANSGNWWDRRKEGFRRNFAKLLEFRVLAAGQLLLTGDHHGARSQESDFIQQHCELLAKGMQEIANSLWPEKLHGLILKDLPLGQKPEQFGYYSLPVQPNMLLKLDPEWQNLDNYMSAMSSKYRVRVRRARKKGESLTKRLLDLEYLQRNQERMHELYRSIVDGSAFSATDIPKDYFVQWKKHFPEEVRIEGYFDGEVLIGFTTGIHNEQELEAHYLGFDQRYNRSHQLYLNMLYDLVEQAIEKRVSTLVFSRTAMEIKSSVGAVPEQLNCWLKGQPRWSNALIPIIAPYVAPPEEWVQRHPFK